MIKIISTPQQLFLHEVASRKSLPVIRPYTMGPNINMVKQLIRDTKFLEVFRGKDSSDWVRLTAHGRAFVEGTEQ